MSPHKRSRYNCSKRTLRLNTQDKEPVKNDANRTNKIRSDEIQKNGRAELPTEKNAVRQRPEKKTCPKIQEGKKCGPEIWIPTKPQAQRRFYGTLQVNRNRPLLK